MSELRSTTVVPIACYCFFLGIVSIFLAARPIFDHKTVLSGNDSGSWIPVTTFMIIACALAAVGIGILRASRLCWKILFFSLAICVSCVASLVLDYLICLVINTDFVISYSQIARVTPAMWFTFLFFFLSEIIVLYYLASNEVSAYFGGMDDLMSPF